MQTTFDDLVEVPQLMEFHAVEPFEGRQVAKELNDMLEAEKLVLEGQFPFVFIVRPLAKEGALRCYENGNLKEVVVEMIWSGCNRYKLDGDKVSVTHTHPDAPYLKRWEYGSISEITSEHRKFFDRSAPFDEIKILSDFYLLKAQYNEHQIPVHLLSSLSEPLVIRQGDPRFLFTLVPYLMSQRFLKQRSKPQSVITFPKEGSEFEMLASEFFEEGI